MICEIHLKFKKQQKKKKTVRGNDRLVQHFFSEIVTKWLKPQSIIFSPFLPSVASIRVWFFSKSQYCGLRF